MSYLEKLKNTTSIYDFAKLLDFEPSALSYLLYKLPNKKKYTEFKIPKKSGGDRLIKAPDCRLKLVQRKLADILNSCAQEIEKTYIPRKGTLSHGFKKKIDFKTKDKPNYLALGIHTNAKCHRNKRYVLNIDLADFFPSFNFGRVRGFFIKNNDFELSPYISTLIAQIACHENGLPQGSPCSPIITNLIMHILDVRLTQLAKQYKCSYSRYVDDITLSTNQKVFPEKLAHKSSKFNAWEVGTAIEKIIKRSGFKVNSQKTRLQFRTSRQVVTGLVVNKKVNIKSEYHRYARSMCHALFTRGTFYLPGKTDSATIHQLEGILSHIYFIKKFSRTTEELLHWENVLENAKKNKQRATLDGVSELYSKFLYFRYFVALEKPLILCEGKTDIVYLKAAIKQLAKKNIYKFPHDNIDFFSHTDRISKVMQIHDGTNALENFIKFYDKNTNFKFSSRRYPVIVILDNDCKAKNVINFINGKCKQKEKIVYDRYGIFYYHVTSNLYVILLPIAPTQNKCGNRCNISKKNKLMENKCNKIEDFFDSLITDTVLNSKIFSAENGDKFDNQKHYGKHIFATKVIRPQQEEIDFSKFKEILELISKVIIDYNNPKPQ